MLGPIVDEVVAIDEALAMCQGDAFLEQVAKVASEPYDFVAPCFVSSLNLSIPL